MIQTIFIVRQAGRSMRAFAHQSTPAESKWKNVLAVTIETSAAVSVSTASAFWLAYYHDKVHPNKELKWGPRMGQYYIYSEI
ncbi:MAG: hypothetical protein Q9195_004318 [Heterodermia aff. obscurata]